MTANPQVWPSPLSAELVVAGAATPGEVRCSGESVLWSERRPDEGGRVQIVLEGADGTRRDLLGDGVSARTRVHEYGGGAWAVSDADRRLRRRCR